MNIFSLQLKKPHDERFLKVRLSSRRRQNLGTIVKLGGKKKLLHLPQVSKIINKASLENSGMTRINANKRISTKWFNNIQSSLEAIESTEQFFNILSDIKKEFDFDKISSCVITQNNFRNETYYYCSTQPEEWKQTYLKNQYWKIDTRIIVARNQATPFQWSSRSDLADFIVNDIMAGNWDGMTIPIHGVNHSFGLLNFTFNPKQKKIRCWLSYIGPFITYLALYVITAQSSLIKRGLLSPHCAKPDKSYPMLASQQCKCLSWAAEGKTSEEIALILGISISTVNKHLDRAATLLNANNRTHAIVKALHSNLIVLEYTKKSDFFYF
jgi:LuxR family transcriptional activator of bioluminescence operon